MFTRLRRAARALTSKNPLLRMRKSFNQGTIKLTGLVSRSRTRTPVRKMPKYMRKDAKRAKAMGVGTNYKASRSAGRSYTNAPVAGSPMKPHVFVGGRKSQGIGHTRASRLSVYRHEIGHQEAFRNKRDVARMNRLYQKGIQKNQHAVNPAWNDRFARKIARRNEVLGWKNAIRASKNANVHWPTVKTALSSYYQRRSGKLAPHYHRDLKKLQRYQRMIRRPGFRARFQKRK